LNNEQLSSVNNAQLNIVIETRNNSTFWTTNTTLRIMWTTNKSTVCQHTTQQCEHKQLNIVDNKHHSSVDNLQHNIVNKQQPCIVHCTAQQQ
jgi:hypothetical protein